MGTILCVGTSGFCEPTQATLPFVTALSAIEAGHRAQIALMGDATFLMKDSIAEQIHGEGWPPLKEVLEAIVANGVPIYV